MSVLRSAPPTSDVPPIAASDLDAIAHRLKNTIADLDALSALLRKVGTDRLRDHPARDTVTARLTRWSAAFDELAAEARQLLLDSAAAPRAVVGRVRP